MKKNTGKKKNRKALNIVLPILLAAAIAVLVYVVAGLRVGIIDTRDINDLSKSSGMPVVGFGDEDEAAEEIVVTPEPTPEPDYRTYNLVYPQQTGRTKVDAIFTGKCDEAIENFKESSANSADSTLTLTGFCFENKDFYSYVLIADDGDSETIETFLVDAETLEFLTIESVLGDNYRTLFADYFDYNVEVLYSKLSSGYREYIEDQSSNFNYVAVKGDGTAIVYFHRGEITDGDSYNAVGIPANVLTGEYYDMRKLYPNKPMVALTLDDGPGDYEDEILELFQEYGVVGTFFYIGKNVDANPEVVKRVADAGNEIGSHTYWHMNMTTLDEANVISDKAKADEAFMNAIGYIPTLLRPPEGACGGLAKYTWNCAYIGWSCDTEDWLVKNANMVVDSVKKYGDLSGQVILVHSIYPTTVEALKEIVPWLLDEGYQFVTMSELLKYQYGIDEPEAHLYYAVDFFTRGVPAQ